MKGLTSENIQTCIKWSLLELATNLSIDHRNYSQTNKPKESPLVQSIKANGGSFDQGINMLAQSIVSDQDMSQMVQELAQLHGDKESYNCDEIYDLETDLFDKFIELIGLFEINSLHGDSVDKFRDKFFEFVY